MKKIYILSINWHKAQQEKPHSLDRLKYVKLQAFNEGDDIANYIQYFDKYEDGWRVYIYITYKKASQIFEMAMNKGK